MGNELEALRAKVAELEVKNKELSEAQRKSSGGMLEDIRRQSRKNRGTTGAIPYKETRDYTPLTLYHTNGVNISKVVGPMHPDSAEDTYMRFSLKKGIILSIKKPTDSEIEAYKQTEEYKDLMSKEVKRRESRTRTMKEGAVDRLAKEIEKLSGKKIVNAIKRQEDVK